jgi:hypothetical protein
MPMTHRKISMAEPLRAHAQDLADYLTENMLDYDELTGYDILDALASLGITLVEDPIADSTLTYYESLPKPDDESLDRS